MSLIPQSKGTKKIVFTFFVVLVLFCGLSGTYLYFDWRGYLKESRKDLMSDAQLTMAEIRMSLLNSKILLHLIAHQIQSHRRDNFVLVQGEQNSPVPQAVLESTREELNRYHKLNHLGLTMVLDPSGKVVAWTGPKQPSPADLSDRSFYKEIKADAFRQYSLDTLSNWQVPKGLIYQLAIPVRNPNGDLAYILCQQIKASDAMQTLHGKITSKYRIAVRTIHGGVLSQYPLLPITSDAPRYNKKNHKLPNTQKFESMVSRIPGGTQGFKKTTYVASLKSVEYDLIITSMVTERELLEDFLRHQWLFFPVFLLVIILLTALFYNLSLQSQRLESALFQAITDPITGLKNRRGSEIEFARLVDHSIREKKPLSFLYVDIDQFKSINDLYGHDKGDEVLKEVATCIQAMAKRPLDVCGRWGGDEFVLILPDTDSDQALVITDQLRNCVHRIQLEKLSNISSDMITISIGIACLARGEVFTCEELIQRADQALIRTKKDRGDSVLTI